MSLYDGIGPILNFGEDLGKIDAQGPYGEDDNAAYHPYRCDKRCPAFKPDPLIELSEDKMPNINKSRRGYETAQIEDMSQRAACK
jgi:hypothetical protein